MHEQFGLCQQFLKCDNSEKKKKNRIYRAHFDGNNRMEKANLIKCFTFTDRQYFHSLNFIFHRKMRPKLQIMRTAVL